MHKKFHVRKLAVLLFCLFLLNIVSVVDASISKKDCRIGNIGIGDEFNIDILTKEMGKMLGKPQQVRNIHGDTFYYKDELSFAFAKGPVRVKQGKIIGFRIVSPTASDGTKLKTPRGLSVGDSIDSLLKIYGFPTEVSNGGEFYIYQSKGLQMTIIFNQKNNKINSIAFTQSRDKE